ncbi:MAG: cobalamin-dependent protein [Candidatus Thermoplasmatota archaeon]|nr:cobalamin-dependent protein [Candidatus Thermoplasmatota archaeon]
MSTKVLFVEPPKDYWFLMGEYLPPPTGLLVLAAYLERELPDVEIEVLDCQAERKGWEDVEKHIESFTPQIVAASGFTANAYACAKVAEAAKRVNSDIVTVLGGQHFSFTTEDSLSDFPEIDYIVRGEGEVTLVELIRALRDGQDVGRIEGLSFRNNGGVVHTPQRPLIENLDTLPFPAYHLVEKNIGEYHFTMMAGKSATYMILEGSRGCRHRCSFCTQWKHWNGMWRTKSPKRIADEMEHFHQRFGGQFLWLTDDNFDYRSRGEELWRELRQRDFTDDIAWFFQARTDDIANNPDLVAKLREVGNSWILIGVESNSPEVLKDFKKGLRVGDAARAVKVLNDNDVFTQSMLVMGSRRDTAESIKQLRRFSLELDTHLAIYTVLTPYPGTEVHETALRNGWIEDSNYAHYDMVHAIMPTESLSRDEVQQELYRCYNSFYGSVPRNIAGLFSRNKLKRRAYRHMAGKSVLRNLRRLI